MGFFPFQDSFYRLLHWLLNLSLHISML